MPLFSFLWLSYWLSIGYIFNFLNFVYLYAVRGSQTMLVQFGSLITQGAGKIGGHVVQRGSFGQIMRTKTSPVVRRGSTNQLPRNCMAHVASYWRFLSENDKLSWVALAATQTRYNKFGTAYTPNAYQMFLELNQNLVYYPIEPVLETAPAAPNFPVANSWALNVDPSGPTFTMTWTYLSGDTSFRVFPRFYPLQSLGAAVPRGNPLRLSLKPSISTGTINMQSDFFKRFGTVADGQYQVAVNVVIVDEVSGFASSSFNLMVPYST
jgi:hypothetical protein